ncbi:hypothetical protein BUALT_Bualt05G0066900 [Buddleja alternifolia]|uniref:TPX2 central domain-containing protein n=1 Tax=Buddleja alternifolia TaxID=168488 RepID=A0AAV6XQL9_9LAMI|nr:hypothetical protein BUALT_Bualt05G0066900 [Buddleja alternifolia]
MEEEMMEDNNVNVNVSVEAEYSFTAYEIDLDYEFDAARFFDFSQAESPLEATQAELWFHSAGSYPPSPFVRLVQREGILTENVNVSPKSKGVEDMNLLESDSDIEVDQEICVADMNNRELYQLSKVYSSSTYDSEDEFTSTDGLKDEFASNDLDSRISGANRILPTVLHVYSDTYDLEDEFVSEDGLEDEFASKDNVDNNDVRDKGTSTTRQMGSKQKSQDPCQKLPSGLTFYNHMLKNNSKTQTKLSMKPSIPRTSTLMKPTSSQLAKQNHPLQAGYSRPNTSLEKTNKSSTSTCGIENQAAKRQKLEGGLLRKVEGAVQLQQTNFIHKAPKRDELLYNTTHTKPRITIPREPDLETAQRAQRTRPKGINEADNVAPAVRRFKALPLNRKILQAPSLIPKRSIPRLPDFQEFHFKTSGRAMHHHSAVLKSRVPCDNPDKALNKYSTNLTSDFQNKAPSRPSFINASRLDGCETSHNFKALPLNKKILSSKGDIGVFRNSKKEITVPMEFNFQTEKRSHHNPPIELFNKLSLASERLPIANSKLKLPQSSISMKGSKENRWGCFHQGNEIKQPAKPKLLMVGGKQQFTADERKNEASNASGINWSKDIR